MSARSCSLAWAVFFARNPVAGEEPPQRCDAGAHPAPGQHHAQLVQRDVGLRLDGGANEPHMFLDLCRATIAALRLGGRRAVLKRELSTADRTCSAYPEPLRRSSARQSTARQRQLHVPADHATRLDPSPPASFASRKAESENRGRGNPQRFRSPENRSSAVSGPSNTPPSSSSTG